MRTKLLSLTLTVLAVLFSSCVWMYSTRPGTIPSHIKSVSIEDTENNTAEFNLGEDFTVLLIDKMNLENLLPLTDASVANSLIYTTIKNISDQVFSYDETEVVKEYKLSLSIDFRWYDAINDKDMMKKILSDYEIYYSDTYNNSLSPDGQVTREIALERLKDKMADKVITELTSQW